MRVLRFLAIPALLILSLAIGSVAAMGAAQNGAATPPAGACPTPTMIAGTAVPPSKIPTTAATAATAPATEVATEAATEAATEPATKGATAATKASCPAIVAKISVGDFFFKPNKLTIPAGKDVTFTFTNGASVEHYFVIDSQHISVELKPGKTVTKTLNLPKGSYEFYCKVPGHKQLGMVGQLIAQ